jgi:hypothetical protein
MAKRLQKFPANEPGLPGAQGSSANNRDNPNSKDKITGTTSKSNSLLESYRGRGRGGRHGNEGLTSLRHTLRDLGTVGDAVQRHHG